MSAPGTVQSTPTTAYCRAGEAHDLATLTAALVPRIARKHGRLRAAVARLLLGPLGLATRLGDRLATWLV